jgi:ribose/xylose/arabinose/galactoside ABC-type transport system permease subunit
MATAPDSVLPVEAAAEPQVESAPTYVAAAQLICITLVAVVLFVVFSFTADNFFTSDNILNILRLVSFTAIVGVGMTYLFIAGEFDISVGSTFGLSAVLITWLVSEHGMAPWPAAALALVLGAVIGLVNGLVVTRVGVPSLIVTLGMLNLVRGAALVLTGGIPLAFPVTMHTSLTSLANGSLLRVPAEVWWMALALVAGTVVLRTTTFGFHVYATGGNQAAARASGIDTRRIKLLCFVLTGLSAALIGVLQTGWLETAPPTTGTGFELDVIGAVVIGGIALTGGEGSVYGMFVGAFILGILSNGIVLLGVQADYTEVVIGAIVILAASLDVTLRRQGKLAAVLGIRAQEWRGRAHRGPRP